MIARILAIAAAVSLMAAQGDVTDAQLASAGGGRTLRIGSFPGGDRVTETPIEVYVSRVLAGEAEPDAPHASLEALAIVIRTFALVNGGRHAGEGFDLCDSTHCQVPRNATAATRRAALATAGRLLTWNGAPAEVFYSASCGGRSESAADIWSRANLPYLRVVEDDVHDDDQPWTLEVTLSHVERALARVGFDGRLRDVKVDERTGSGRAGRIKVTGLRPDVITGDAFRLAIGARELRSTAFSVDRDGARLRFTGRGYGHGVGMCVIGAGRRARRGDDAEEILGLYYPGLRIERLGGEVGRAESRGDKARPTAAVAAPVIAPGALQNTATRAYRALAKTLGVTATGITINSHESIDSFRNATGKPWWVSAAVNGSAVDLAPRVLLEQRDGVDAAVHAGIAEVLVAPVLAGRPVWVRVGAARFFAREVVSGPGTVRPMGERTRCPSDAELTLAISASAQRDAEARAEACFARAYAQSGDWRTVR